MSDARGASHANVAVFVPNLGCPHRCTFCDQRAIAGQARMPGPQDVAAAAREGIRTLGEHVKDAELAFFGGSFTAIPPVTMTALLAAAQPFLGPGGYRGIRVSTRPDAVPEGMLALLRRYGVKAVELGAQSMSDQVLRRNGRGHTARDVTDAAGRVKAAGLELGLQMMTGLPGDGDKGAWDTARAIAALSPDTVRIYPTVVVRGTALQSLYISGRYAPQTLEAAVALCAQLLLFFHEKGIRVIRCGLHAERSLSDAYIAGPLHPAFRELCENRIYERQMRAALRSVTLRCPPDETPAGPLVLRVPRGAVSKAAGQRRAVLDALERETGLTLRLREDPALPVYAVEADMPRSPSPEKAAP